MEFHVTKGLADAPEAWAIRNEVFVQEQGFSLELEFDEYDDDAIHVTGFIDGDAVCTARIFTEEGAPQGVLHVGRVCVRKDGRGKGTGALLINKVADVAKENGAIALELGAQVTAKPFYEKLGYAVSGAEFLDEGVPHVLMRKEL